MTRLPGLFASAGILLAGGLAVAVLVRSPTLPQALSLTCYNPGDPDPVAQYVGLTAGIRDAYGGEMWELHFNDTIVYYRQPAHTVCVLAPTEIQP